jgi:tryptophanyl-tRNA synthetase
MIQFKEKSQNQQTTSVGVGLLNYPILMAADILLYQTHLVPVGEDQKQHLELTRQLVRKFHELYPQPTHTFTEPRGMILSNGCARIMSLSDGTKKMSKSHPNDFSRINLLDTSDIIQKKIRRSKSDAISYLEYSTSPTSSSDAGGEKSRSNESSSPIPIPIPRPECTNLLNIYQQCTGKSPEEVMCDVQGMNWGQFKPLLAEVVIEHLKPIQRNYHELIQEEEYLEEILREGSEQAAEVAEETLKRVKEAMGFYQLKRR